MCINGIEENLKCVIKEVEKSEGLTEIGLTFAKPTTERLTNV